MYIGPKGVRSGRISTSQRRGYDVNRCRAPKAVRSAPARGSSFSISKLPHFFKNFCTTPPRHGPQPRTLGPRHHSPAQRARRSRRSPDHPASPGLRHSSRAPSTQDRHQAVSSPAVSPRWPSLLRPPNAPSQSLAPGACPQRSPPTPACRVAEVQGASTNTWSKGARRCNGTGSELAASTLVTATWPLAPALSISGGRKEESTRCKRCSLGRDISLHTKRQDSPVAGMASPTPRTSLRQHGRQHQGLATRRSAQVQHLAVGLGVQRRSCHGRGAIQEVTSETDLNTMSNVRRRALSPCRRSTHNDLPKSSSIDFDPVALEHVRVSQLLHADKTFTLLIHRAGAIRNEDQGHLWVRAQAARLTDLLAPCRRQEGIHQHQVVHRSSQRRSQLGPTLLGFRGLALRDQG